jgi:hypothetical protein
MDLTLRPGEGLELRWDHIGKQYTAGLPLKPGQKKRDGLGDLLAGWGPTAYDNLRNGKLRYRPDLSSPLGRRGAEEAENATFDQAAGQLRPTGSAKPARITWRFASPYVFVGGRATVSLRLSGGAAAEWRYSADRQSWTTIASADRGQTGSLIAYKVYGSDERGFSVSDDEHLVFRGKGFVASMEDYAAKPADAPDAGLVRTPGNLIARVTATRLQVAGPELSSPNCNRAFYRVVAIDSAGNESGPSDYAAAPRPFVYTRPKSPAKAGSPYRYQPKAIRSIGDLRCRRSSTSSYNAAFWDRERLAFKAVRLPPGLSLDLQTGLISGTPARSGAHDIIFEVSASPGESTTVAQRLVVVE